MLAGLIIILLLVLSLPFFVKLVEQNLEVFLFLMGLASTIVSAVLTKKLVLDVLGNNLLYMITAAVLIAGILFKLLQDRIKGGIDAVLRFIPFKVFIFLVVVILGLLSSVITAIIASLVLVEIVNNLPIDRKNKINLVILACFSIGMGAALTPVGEPLSTIVISKMHGSFWYLMMEIGKFIIPGILAIGFISTFLVGQRDMTVSEAAVVASSEKEINAGVVNSEETPQIAGEEEETYVGLVIRAVKVFVFVLALDFLGAGFKPVVDTYIINLDSRILYWINMISAILDNATLAAAEVSKSMDSLQVEAVLMGLIISGGMLIPGNIPNIISAGKLKISSSEWVRLGVPLGLTIMVIYYVLIFVI